MNVKFPELSEEERRKKMTIPNSRIRLVIDTDAKNEVDDQFAVSWAIRSPDRFNVEAVYAAPFSFECMKISRLQGGSPAEGMNASYEELIKLYSLLGENPSGKVFRGSDNYISKTGKAVESDAAKDLIHRAMSSDETLYVAAIGAPTNVASALMMEPELVKKIVVIWLGGQPLYFEHGIEFNLMQDIEASRVLFNSGVPLIYVPCMSVASSLTLTKPEIETHMIGKNAISNYLAEIVLQGFPDEKYAGIMPSIFRNLYLAKLEDQGEEYLAQFPPTEHAAWSRIIWDISVIAFLKNPVWMLSNLQPSPVLQDDFFWGPKDSSRHSIRVVNYCHRDLVFGDMFACLGENK